jgi:hypothetical protein
MPLIQALAFTYAPESRVSHQKVGMSFYLCDESSNSSLPLPVFRRHPEP